MFLHFLFNISVSSSGSIQVVLTAHTRGREAHFPPSSSSLCDADEWHAAQLRCYGFLDQYGQCRQLRQCDQHELWLCECLISRPSDSSYPFIVTLWIDSLCGHTTLLRRGRIDVLKELKFVHRAVTSAPTVTANKRASVRLLSGQTMWCSGARLFFPQANTV